MDHTDNTDPIDPLRTLEKDDSEDLFKSAFNGSAGVIKITSDSDCEPGNNRDNENISISNWFLVDESKFTQCVLLKT